MGQGREGDWECGGCQNRNYAFRSFCNRCKQPRLLVDTKTPADSKWLPRIGDWICTGCTNNNYASREKCKKCGQPKEIAAMTAIAMPGASLPTYAHYFARAQGGPVSKMSMGMSGNSALQQSLPLNPNWSSFGGADKYGLQPASGWPFAGNNSGGFPYANNVNQPFVVPKDWRNGDWICNCGFHNYSSRAQCKKCNASVPSGAPTPVANSAVSDFFPSFKADLCSKISLSTLRSYENFEAAHLKVSTSSHQALACNPTLGDHISLSLLNLEMSDVPLERSSRLHNSKILRGLYDQDTAKCPSIFWHVFRGAKVLKKKKRKEIKK